VKNVLRVIIVLSLLALAGLAFRAVIPRVVLLDFVLPPRVLANTTTEERNQITARLSASHRPSFLAWIPPIGILLLSSYALALEKKKARSFSPSYPPA
jgi:hypothetical protein